MTLQWPRTLLGTSGKSLLLLSILTGFATGIAAWFFIKALEFFQFWPAHAGDSHFLHFVLNRPMIVAIPTLGGLLCGWIVQSFAPGVKGTGTADLIYVLRRKNGHIHARYTFFKSIASLFTICSGAAAGPEAPVVQIGAGVGSFLGRLRKLSPDYMRTLVAAGAAAGFAAVFNAPIAGVLFAIEVLLKQFASQAFAMVILSTVTASVTTHLLLGNRVFVRVPSTFTFNHVPELGFYLVLGILSALVAKAFVRIYFLIEHQFEDLSLSQMIRTALGGLLIGLMALYLPEVMGNGHDVIPHVLEAEIANPYAWTFLLLLLLGKMVACPITIGSGGSGGIFIPYLLMGEMVGGMIGRWAHLVFPAAAPSGAYMLVGMGAVFAGITFAPFTAIILLFELTGDYNIILPLMFTVGVTMMVARWIDPQSMDSHKLLKKGLRLHERIELSALENVLVKEVMSASVQTLPDTMPFLEITQFIGRTHHTGFPVTDSSGQVVGILTAHELYQASIRDQATQPSLCARDMMRTKYSTAYPDEPLTEVVRRMQQDQIDRVLVVDPHNSNSMVGIVTKSDVLSIYRSLFQ